MNDIRDGWPHLRPVSEMESRERWPWLHDYPVEPYPKDGQTVVGTQPPEMELLVRTDEIMYLLRHRIFGCSQEVRDALMERYRELYDRMAGGARKGK